MAKKQRLDADRRGRQCERLGRLLQMLHLIMGKGRWDACTLAAELNCSRRTIYRLLQTLSMAGVPWQFDKDCRCYRVRPGFKFSGFDGQLDSSRTSKDSESLKIVANQLLEDAEKFVESLRTLCEQLGRSAIGSP